MPFDPNNLGTRLLQQSPEQNFQRNASYIAPGAQSFSTLLSPDDEVLFQNWAQSNRVPYNPTVTRPGPRASGIPMQRPGRLPGPADYDMRGYYNALVNMDPRAQTAMNENDASLHFPDTFKTPYHETFSNESQYANQNAPRWLNDSQLGTPGGRLIFDERRGY